MFFTSLSNLNRNWMVSFSLNVFLVFSIVVTLFSPTSFAQSNRPENQNTVSIQTSGNQISQDCSHKHKCALHFNGTDQWVNLEQFHGFDTPAFTLETWFSWTGGGTPIPANSAGLTGGIPFITIGGNPGSDIDANLFFGIQASTGNLMAVFKEEASASGSPTHDHSIFGITPITPGIWHHAAVTYDGQTWKLFLDGNLDTSQTFAAPVLPQLVSSQHAYLAAALSSNGAGRGFFKGALDEVRIWEIARSQNDIQAAINLENVSDPNLTGHWSMNEGTGNEENDSSGNGIQGKSVHNPTWTNDAPYNLSIVAVNGSESNTGISAAANVAPDPPTLISPTNGATNVTTSPTLNVFVSDPEASNLTVTFYGRATPGTQSSDFTVAVLPDTQKYTINGMGIFGTQTQWIVDQRSAQNIAFVAHLGDMVDDWNVPDQWNVANAAMSKLEPSGIPYGIVPGNCDEDHYGVPPDTTFFNTYFPVSRFAGRAYYGGAYNGDNANSYQLFSAGGLDFIVINLKYNLSTVPDLSLAVLNWANDLLHTYSNRRAIVVTHNLLDTSNVFSTDGSQIYNKLKENPNLFLMLGGHLDTEGQRQDPGNDGHTIYSLRSDYQTRTNGGNGWLRLMRFSSSANKIYVTTYSPYLNQYETDADSQFPLDYNMNGANFQVIGTTNVASGSNTSMNWNNLLSNKQYEWYVTVNDGTATTTGSTWNFTTGNTPISTPTFTPTSTATSTATGTATATPTSTNTPTNTAISIPTYTPISTPTYTPTFTPTYTPTFSPTYTPTFTPTYTATPTNTPTSTPVNTAPVITTQPANQTVISGQSAAFTAAASGYPTPTVQWQMSADNGNTWNNIAGAISSTYSFTAQSTDNGKKFRAVFVNAAGSTTSNVGLLTVISDLIFKDDFNSCNATTWTGGTVNSARLAFNTASGRNSTCGMAVTIVSSTAAYVVDPLPNAETHFRARFYFNPNTVKMGKNTANTIYVAYNISSQATIVVQIRYSGNTFQLRSGLLSDANAWSYTGWTSISKAWHAVEFDWHASTTTVANNGGLAFWIDGTQRGSFTTINNDQHKIDKAALGAVLGVDSTMSGTYFFDDYESRRQNYIGQ